MLAKLYDSLYKIHVTNTALGDVSEEINSLRKINKQQYPLPNDQRQNGQWKAQRD